MTTWYRISQYGRAEITEVEVTHETAEFVTVQEKTWDGKSFTSGRRRKAGEYFRIREEAKAHLISRYERELGHARDQVSRSANNLKQAREL